MTVIRFCVYEPSMSDCEMYQIKFLSLFPVIFSLGDNCLEIKLKYVF